MLWESKIKLFCKMVKILLTKKVFKIISLDRYKFTGVKYLYLFAAKYLMTFKKLSIKKYQENMRSKKPCLICKTICGNDPKKCLDRLEEKIMEDTIEAKKN